MGYIGNNDRTYGYDYHPAGLSMNYYDEPNKQMKLFIKSKYLERIHQQVILLYILIEHLLVKVVVMLKIDISCFKWNIQKQKHCPATYHQTSHYWKD